MKNSIKENQEYYPHMVEQFHPTLNGKNTIENVTIKSAKMITWICNKGHIWQARPYNNIKSPHCPICTGKIITKETSLGGKHPDLVAAFSTKNKQTIFEVSELSSKNYIWECEKGHEYKARPSVKVKAVNKHWCPVCNGVETDLNCPECGVVFPNKIGLATHMRVVHDSGIKKCKIKGCENTVKEYSKTCSEHAGISRKITKQEFDEKIQLIVDKSPVKCITDYEEYLNNKADIIWECDKGHVFKRTFQSSYNNSASCPICHPKGISLLETEIVEFIESLGFEVERNTRGPIKPLEIDIFIPSQRVGIEFNGLYWHSELFKDKKYHLNKLRAAQAANIRLVNMFEDEWVEKKDICKSMIVHMLGQTENKIHARKCVVVEVDKKTRREFFEQNHIMGDTGANKAFGLEYNGEIISVVSLRKALGYTGSLELARYATKLNHSVSGGFSKLLRKVVDFCKLEGAKELITYSLNSHATGDVYKKSGFEYVKDTDVDYWYVEGTRRVSRMKYRARPGKSEKEVAEEAGVLKIYGCGSKLFRMRLI